MTEQLFFPLADLSAAPDQKNRVFAPSKQLAAMYLRHGRAQGKTCGDCAHLVRLRADMATKPFKCQEFGITRSAASDWRLKWPACGLFKREQEGVPNAP